MCGIAGAIGHDVPRHVTGAMLDAIAHRGPDGRGIHHGPGLTVGAVRLAIVGGPGGGQPVRSPGSAACIVFNGEIYNYRGLRQSLAAGGYRFGTRTDTEVILALDGRDGPDCVRRLEGMYAFAVADGGSLFLARDPVGMKPLYVYPEPGGRALYFASEIKALLQVPGLTPALEESALADSALVGRPCGSATFVAGVRCLMPGETLTARLDGGRLETGGAPPPRPAPIGPGGARDLGGERRARAALGRAVASHLDADPEVALALSGGVGSALLAAVAGRPLSSFTVCAAGDDPDAAAARGVAGQLGLRHREVRVRPASYAARIAGAVAVEEQPPALGALPLAFLFGTVARQAKVCLMGEGADEVFGGYLDHVRPGPAAAWQPAGRQARLARLTRAGLRPTAAALELADLRGGGPESALRADLGAPLVRQHLELVDKYSMAAGLEVRLPYLDAHVYASGLALTSGSRLGESGTERKRLLREMLAERMPAGSAGILAAPKRGFPASGLGLLRGFARYCAEHIPERYAQRHELAPVYERTYQLVLFDLFRHVMLEHRGRVPDGFRLADFLASCR
jgi:asparagine synthase (glutamine-hydrolysing)